MENYDLLNQHRLLLQRQAELEKELEEKLRREKQEKDIFIQSQIAHEAMQEEQRREEQRAALQQEREREEEAMQEEEQLAAERARQEEERRMEEADQAVDLLGSGMEGMDEQTRTKLINDLIMGRKSPVLTQKAHEITNRQKTPAGQADSPDKSSGDEGAEKSEQSIESVKEIPLQERGIMIGNTLKNLSRFAACEVPLSVKHAEVARLCSNILKRAAQQGITRGQMGLQPDEWLAVQGSIQLGNIVKRGLEAKEALSNPDCPSGPRRDIYLRDYLTMNALEQALRPHVQKHGEEIAKGEGPLSSIQLMLGTPEFSARKMWNMMWQTDAMAKLYVMKQSKVAQLVSHENREMDDLGRQAMTACYDGSLQKGKAPAEHGKGAEPIQMQPQAQV